MQPRLSVVFLVAALLSCDSPTDSPTVASIVITPPDPAGYATLLTADELQLRAEVKRFDGSIDANIPITWRSARPPIASVDNTGLVRAAETYAACNVFSRPLIGCAVAITATAGGRSDTVTVIVKPRIVYEYARTITIAVGDSAPMPVPLATVDGEVVCTYFGIQHSNAQIVQIREQSSGRFVIGLTPGEAQFFYLPWSYVCNGVSTVVRVLAG